MTNAERNEAAYYSRLARFWHEEGLNDLADRDARRAVEYVYSAEWFSTWAEETERLAGVCVFPGVTS